MAGEPEDADGSVAQGGHDLRAAAGADGGSVFVERDVANPVQPVLDGPMAANPGRDLGGSSGGHRHRGDQIDHLDGLATALLGNGATDLQHLRGVGGAETGIDFGGRDRATFETSMPTTAVRR